MEVFLDTAAVSLRSTSVAGSQPAKAGESGDFLATLQWVQQQAAAWFPSSGQPQFLERVSSDAGGEIPGELVKENHADREDSDSDTAERTAYLAAVPFGWMPVVESADQPVPALTGNEAAIGSTEPPTTNPAMGTGVSPGKQRAPTSGHYGEQAQGVKSDASLPDLSAATASAETPSTEMGDPPLTANRPVRYPPTVAKAEGDGQPTAQTNGNPAFESYLPNQATAPPAQSAPSPTGHSPPAAFTGETTPSTQDNPTPQLLQLEWEGLQDQSDGKQNPVGERASALPHERPKAAQGRHPDGLMKGQVDTKPWVTGKTLDGQNPLATAARDGQPALLAVSQRQFPDVAPPKPEDKIVGRESVWATAAVPKPAGQMQLKAEPPPTAARPEPIPVQMAEQVRIMVNQGKQTFHVKLQPEGCGEVTLHLEMTEGALSVDIRTSLPSTKTMILDQLGELRQALLSNNIQVSEIQVSCENAQSGVWTPFDTFRDGFSGGARGRQDYQLPLQRQADVPREVRQPVDGGRTYLLDFQWGRFSRRI